MTLSQPTAAPRACSAYAATSATLPTVIGTSIPSSTASAAPIGSSTQPVVGLSRTSPSSRRTMPHTATPAPTQIASGGTDWCISLTAPASSGAASPATRLRGRSISRRSSTSPPSPTRAARSRSTSTLYAYA